MFSDSMGTTGTKGVLLELVAPSESDVNERRKILIVYEDCAKAESSSKRKKIRAGNHKKFLKESTWKVLSVLSA